MIVIIVIAYESDAGDLSVILMDPLRSGAVGVVHLLVTDDTDQHLVVNGDVVVGVDVLLGMVDGGEDLHVDGRHGHGKRGPGEGVRSDGVTPLAVPDLTYIKENLHSFSYRLKLILDPSSEVEAISGCRSWEQA